MEPLQPLLRNYIGILETEGLPLTPDTLRPRMQLEKLTVWSGVKTLYGGDLHNSLPPLHFYLLFIVSTHYCCHY